MASRAYASIEGLDKLQRALKEAPKATRRLLTNMLHTSADSVASHARDFVPVDRGDLRFAIETAGRGLTWRAGIGDRIIPSRGGSASHQDPRVYGPMVERGSAHNTARPFMKPAAEGEATQIVGRLRGVAAAIPGESS